ncbi:hypothetical protein HQ529_06275 [Candidatus Woesearchaeota archaeon]|nr:hypothetical protein [Candidatus Woesearchaeota archaeon]
MVSFAVIGIGMWEALKAILASPFKDWSIWWLLAPVFILWIFMELYFGKFKKEKLGWNTSLANGISLSWIGVESMRFLFSNKPDPFWLRFIVISLIILYGLVIFFLAFNHKVPGKIEYLLASPTPVYYLSAVTVLWGFGVLILTWWVLLDLILLFGVFLGLFTLLKKAMPEAEGESEEPSTDTDDFKL